MTKRGNCEGSIDHPEVRNRSVAKGMFIDPRTEKKKSKRQCAATRAKAADQLDEMKADRKDGTLCSPSEMTVGDWLDYWLENIIRPAKRASTHAGYAQVARKHIRPHIGDLKLSALNSVEVEQLYGTLTKSGKSNQLRVKVHITLQAATKAARRRKLIGANPFDDLDSPKWEPPEMKHLRPEEARKFLNAAKGQRLEALFVLAVTTGMRQGELFALRWEDVDLQAGTVSVRRTVVELNGQFVQNPPKTKKGRRLVLLSGIGVEVLKDHRRRMLAEGRVAPDRLVFCDNAGGFLRRQNVSRRAFAAVLKAAQLPKIRFHDLRHTAATLRFANGDNPKVVQELLGHARIGITLDTYSHVLPTMQRESADRLDSLLLGTGLDHGCPQQSISTPVR